MKKYGYIIMALLCLLCLTGCGRQAAENVHGNQTAADWKTDGFAVSGEVMDEQALWIEEYIPWIHDGVPYDEETDQYRPTIEDTCFGEKVYRKYQVIDNDGRWRYFVEIYDTSSMEKTITELDLEQLGIQGERKYLGNMDIVGDQSYAFQVIGYDRDGEEFTLIDDKILYLGSEGITGQTDLLSIYLEKGIVQKNNTAISTGDDCICDGDGNSYVRVWDTDDCYLYVFDRDGNFLMEYKGISESIINPVKTETGDLIFLILNNEEGYTKTRLVWFDVETVQARTLADLGRERVQQLYGMQGSYLYYEDEDGIVRWDVVSGNRQLVFRFAENGVFDVFQHYSTMLLLREGKAPVLRNWGWVNGEEDDWLMVLSEEPVELPGAVRVVSLTEASERVINCAAVVSRRNRSYTFSYEDSGSTDMADFRTQIIAELMAGNGPDILYVSREDMELFQERGLLADLRMLVSEETLNKVMPGVIELGTVDGALVGMAPGVSARSLLVGESVWSGDSWTMDDMLELMESGLLEGRILMNSRTSYYYPFAVVRTIVGYNLENSFLIDWDKRESHFEDERFIKLLEYAGRYDNGDFEGPWDARAAGGGSLMVDVNLWSPRYLVDFQGTREAEGSHYVGFPTEGGNGSFLNADGMLVVNKNVGNPEAVSAFLEVLLGSEIQAIDNAGSSIPITYFAIEDIKYDDKTGEARWNGEKLTVFEDGATSLHEANTLLAQCVPTPRTYTDLEQIIYEELSAYYEQDKTAEETAKIIDNRVQLYLDERN